MSNAVRRFSAVGLRHYFGIRHLAYRHYLAPFSFQKVRDRQGRNRQVAAATAPLSVLFVFIRVP